MSAKGNQVDPIDFVRMFRESYVNYHRVWTAAGSVPDGIELRSPHKYPIEVSELPDDLRRQIELFQERRGDEQLELVKHMRTVDGRPVLVVEDQSDLPDDDEFVSFSVTIATSSADEHQIVSDLVVGRRHR